MGLGTFSQGVKDTAIRQILRRIEALLKPFTRTASGFVPAPQSSSSDRVLHEDGNWKVPSGGAGYSDGDHGDIIVSGTTLTVDNLPQSRITGLTTDITDLRNAVMFIDVKREYGAVGNGTFASNVWSGTDDRAAIQNALNAAATAVAAGTGRVVVFNPTGHYMVSRNGATAYSLDIPAGVEVVGVPNESWWIHPVLGTSQQVSIARINGVSKVVIDGMSFNGNWGAVVGVTDVLAEWQATHGYNVGDRVHNGSATNPTHQYECITAGTSGSSAPTDTTSDITDGTVHWKYIGDGTLDPCNQIPGQADANNNGVAIFGSSDVTVRNCRFEQIYGDAMWVGQRSSPSYLEANNVVFTDCTADVVARHACTNSGGVDRISWVRIRADNVRGGVFDTEGGNTAKRQRNVHAVHCKFGAWWVRKDAVMCAAIVGPNTVSVSEATAARGYRFLYCHLAGPLQITSAYDCEVRGCRFILDTSVAMAAPIYIFGEVDDVRILENYIYDRAPNPGATHTGSINIRFAGTQQRAQNVTIRGNRIHCHSGTGVAGIMVDGAGGSSGESGTATGVTATTLTDTTKSWTTNQFRGQRVRMGGAIGAVETTTASPADVLGFDAWTTGLGETAATPSAGAYEILSNEGMIDVSDNWIYCDDDGNGHGGVGIVLDAGSNIGGNTNNCRATVRHNKVFNAQGNAVEVKFRAAPCNWKYLEICGNTFFDYQVTPTCTVGVKFTTVANYVPSDVLVLDEPPNKLVNVATMYSGLADGMLPSSFAVGDRSVKVLYASTYLANTQRVTLQGSGRLVLTN
jgi:hypothetical protein